MMMIKLPTGSSSSYGSSGIKPPGDPNAEGSPGLILLYAPHYETFAPAYPFQGAAVVIGRDPGSSVCVPEQAVSRQHARIAFDGRHWVLQDLGSRNGTMVDGVFVTGPVELEHLHEIRVGDAIFKFVDAAAERYARYRLDGEVKGERRAKLLRELGGGWQMDHLASELERIAPTQLSCLLLGETGTGKDVAARAIHRISGRRGSIQAINCAAIPHNLLESELFGYRRGAFSGADRDKPGIVKLADGGTLFLDEIGDMPHEAQVKLLRVLQAREVFPLGATSPEYVDIRVVCATHRNLRQLVEEGKFRGDLYGRINEHVVRLPPLRERKEDIFQLARVFAARYGRPNLSFSFSFLVALLHYDWPFNVRELESCLKRGVALADTEVLDTSHLPDGIAEVMKTYGARQRLDSAPTPASAFVPGGAPMLAPARRMAPPTEQELRGILTRHRGNIAAVGRELGKQRMQIHRWMKRYGISIEEYREER